MQRTIFQCPQCNRKYSPSAAESVDYTCEECEIDLHDESEEVPDATPS